jgi:hypothetical protein
MQFKIELLNEAYTKYGHIIVDIQVVLWVFNGEYDSSWTRKRDDKSKRGEGVNIRTTPIIFTILFFLEQLTLDV